MHASTLCALISILAILLAPFRPAHAAAWSERTTTFRAGFAGYLEHFDVKRALLILGNDSLDDHGRLISLLDIVEDIATGWSPRLTYEDKCAKRLVTRDLINIGRSMLQLRDVRYKERIKKILEIAVRKDDEVLFVMLLPLAEFARELIGADVLRARLLSAKSNVGAYAMLLYYQGYGLPEDFPVMRKFAASTKFKVGLWTEDIINTIQKRASKTPLDDSDNELWNPGFFKRPEKELRRLGVYP